MAFAKNIIISIISSINLCLHITGCYLLVCLYKGGRQSVQHVLLINLVLSEIMVNLLIVPFAVTGFLSHSNNSTVLLEYHLALGLAHVTGAYYLYYISMMYLTADRMLATLLNIRYRDICTKRKVKKLLILTWIICILISISMIIVSEHVGNLFITSIGKFALILTFFDLSFTILAITTYCIMFYQFKTSRRLTSGNGNRQTLCSIFLNSKFYISVLLISTFLVFTAIPGLIFTVFFINPGNISPEIDIYAITSINISFTVDAAIYIFMHDSVRKLLIKKLKSQTTALLRRQTSSNPHIQFPVFAIISENETEEHVTRL